MKPRRMALFSSYYTSQELPFYIKYYLTQLKAHTEAIIYITTDDKPIIEQDQTWLRDNVQSVYQVKNEGYDFGMWQKILNQTDDLSQYDELILVNDSCVCLNSLNQYFKWHEAQNNLQVTGMTLSYERTPHIQSYFICIKSAALLDVIHYFKQVDFSSGARNNAIQVGELGLSQYLIAKGHQIGAKYTPNKTDLRNPTSAHCCELIAQEVPIIKRKYLKKYNIDVMLSLHRQTKQHTYDGLVSHIQTHTGHPIPIIHKLIEYPKLPKLSLDKLLNFYVKKITRSTQK